MISKTGLFAVLRGSGEVRAFHPETRMKIKSCGLGLEFRVYESQFISIGAVKTVGARNPASRGFWVQGEGLMSHPLCKAVASAIVRTCIKPWHAERAVWVGLNMSDIRDRGLASEAAPIPQTLRPQA